MQLFIFVLTVCSVTGSVLVNYEKVSQSYVDAPCVKVEIPPNGPNDKNCSEMHQNIIDHVTKNLHDSDIRECYMSVDTGKNQMIIASREVISLIENSTLSAIAVLFKDDSEYKNVFVLQSTCDQSPDGSFNCTSEVTNEPFQVYENKRNNMNANVFNTVQNWRKSGAEKKTSRAVYSEANCTKVEVPDGETTIYMTKIRALEEFGNGQTYGNEHKRECFLDIDTEYWNTMMYYVIMMPSDSMMAFVFYKSEKATAAELICEERGEDKAICRVREQEIPVPGKSVKKIFYH